MSNRPKRLATFSYIGLWRYSLTFCTHDRQQLFTDATAVDISLSRVLQSAAAHAFAVAAYCFMPDHLHLLVEGCDENAHLVAFARDVKQRIGYSHPQKSTVRIWQNGLYDRVLRDDEATLTVAKYILENPVRAGLAREPRDYPFSGSAIWTWDQLMDLWRTDAADAGVVDFGVASRCGTT